MQWNEIRGHFPRQWLLIEAVEAHSAENQRILDEIAVVQAFPDWVSAWNGYQELHHRNLMLELYVVHTDREFLEIGEIRWLGLRPAWPAVT
jgi:hypothetical protein